MSNVHAAGLWDNVKKEAKKLGSQAATALDKNKDEKPSNKIVESELVANPPLNLAPEGVSSVVPNSAPTNNRKPSLTSADIRDEKTFAINATVTPLSFPFPFAWGVNGYYISSRRWMFGVDYQQATFPLGLFGIDIGEVKERHITLQAKRFYGNSFNTTFGYGVRTTTAKHAKDLLDLLTSNYSQTASELETRYLRFGLGNQWQWRKQYSFLIDWFTINIPVSAHVNVSADQYAKDAQSAKKIRDMEGILKWYPSGAIVQVGFGMTF